MYLANFQNRLDPYNYGKCNSIFLRSVQRSPVHPNGQLHVYLPDSEIHVPPFLHGFETHGSGSAIMINLDLFLE